ncbi:choice-of-anchor Q domain-containing protein [Spirosoma endophyticum]|uniref:Ig-like domain-containing protein n=1 Tax=Spirosoma endophyticum TaxID=662367 RepID=A0A1I2I315_9BACT|nr:choice-of-anchor Q domain-containing protein [Spirosoma endophyticum]SFF36020.1 hypothetical protein SAMN05216167_1542 [Spirosoma endophyticum]
MKILVYLVSQGLKSLLVLSLLGALGLPASAQTIRYVSTTGTNTDPATATSWAASTTALQGAIDASNPGDQVWIAGGTYKQVIRIDLNDPLFIEKLATLIAGENGFRMKSGVAIYGGFTGQESSLPERPTSSPSSTTLSGDIIISGNDGGAYKSKHVIYNVGVDNTALLDGVVITGAGGGVAGFLAVGYGGGIYNLGSSPSFVNCLIQGNGGLMGGGVCNQAGNPRFTNCTIRDNAILGQIATASFGGGMANIQSNPVLINCRILDNAPVVSVNGTPTAILAGGGLYNDRSSPLLNNCQLSSNTANRGAGMYSDNNSSPRLLNCLISGNTAGGLGGGLFNSNSSLTMTNCTITANTVTQIGNAQPLNGAAIIHNSASLLQLTNCIVFDNGSPSDAIRSEPAVTQANYCLFQEGTSISPFFVVAPPGTGNVTTAASPFVGGTDFGLKACSPAIDAGDPASSTATSGPTDLAGNPRILATTIDIGAYEFGGSGSTGGFPLRILQQPQPGGAVTAGTSVTAMVRVSGSNPTYQWYKNDLNTPLTGQTSATLTLTNVQLTDEGSYFVVVTGSCNALTSSRFDVFFSLPVRYVKVGGTGNGSSWATAAGDLQAVINAKGTQQVYVAGGRYTSSASSGSFTMKSGVAIFGGFNPDTPENSPANRASVNPLTGPPSSSTLTIAGSTTTNVMSNTGVTATAVLDGFVITGGNATSLPPDNSINVIGKSNNSGGGIFNLNSSPSLVNCLITGNTALLGGGIHNASSSPSLSNCVLSGNSTSIGGGGMSNYDSSNPRLSNCVISGNSSGQGGGLVNSSSRPVLINCLIRENSGTYNGGGILNGDSNPHLINCTLTRNQSPTGAALSNLGGSQPVLTNCILWDNQEGAGTAIDNDGSSSVAANYCLIGAGETDYVDAGHTTRVLNATPFQSPTNDQLTGCSLAINAGNTPAYQSAQGSATDLAGHARIYDTAIDIGAFEFQGGPQVPLALTAQPVSGSTVTVGTPVTAMVSMSGSNPTYQWYKNDLTSPVPGQTTATLSLTSVQLSDAGSYSVVVIGSCNSLTSTAFKLNLIQPVRYVKVGGTGNGTSWATAAGDLQGQINASGVTQVWVAAGTYTPGTNRTASFRLKNGVSVLGGFPATGSPTLTDRQPASYPTILSGEIGDPGDLTDNAYQVIRNQDLDNTAVLDGFIITSGYANGSSGTDNLGGGMYNSNSSPRLLNCILRLNTALGNGGGMYNNNSSPTLINCSVQANNAVDNGGGLYNVNFSSPQLINCLLWGNTASLGKAIDNRNFSRPSLTNCIEWNNDGNSTFLNEDGSSSLTASFCLIEPEATNYNGSNTLTSDPTFVDAAGGNFRLMAGSPAINAGNTSAYTDVNGGMPPSPATDLAGNRRLSGGVIDLGPYEYQALPTQPIRYVRQNGTGDGTSWANAAGDLQGQINLQGVEQVWVAQGSYTPGADRSLHFSLKNGVSILGGFPAAGTPALTDRNPASYPTVLSGEIGQPGDQTDNSYQVLVNTNSELNGTAILDGVLITGGYGYANGGGVRIENGSPRLVNCLITGNSAYQGGGLYTAYSSLTLVNCTISGNTADYGGGLYTSRGTVVMINGLISSNTATVDGGGLFTNNNGDISLLNCSLSGNTAVRGGALLNQTSNPSLVNSIVFSNGGGNTFATSINSNNFIIRTSYSLIETGSTGYTSGPGNLTASSSPFVSPTSFQLKAGSVAINAGSTAAYTTAGGPATDLAGKGRIQNGTIDMGAYESSLPPDLTPLLYVTPSLAYSTTAGSVVLDVFEINSAPTTGPITVYIAKSSLLNLSFDPGATSLAGKPVHNSLWSFDATSNSDAYILTTTQAMGAGGKRSLGLSSTLTPGQTRGRVSVTATLVGGSGGEATLTNNTDADQVEYFNK